MSANFSLTGNSQFDNDSLKSSCNVVTVVFELNLTLFRMGIFGAAHGWGGAKRPPFLKSVADILQR